MLEGVALFVAYGAIALWWLWPLPSVMSDHSAYFSDTIPVVVADFHFITWSLAWGAHALVAQPLHPFDANVFYPAPLPLAFSDHCFGYIPLFAPTYYLTGNPVLAVNVLIFLTYPLAAIAAYALARRWVGRPAAAICGLTFAFYPLRLESIVHFHHLGIQYIPLLFLFTERWLERARKRDAAALAACFALQTLSSFYVAYTVTLGYGAYLIAAAIRWRRSLDRRRVVGLAATMAIAVTPLLLTALPYVKLKSLGIIPSYGTDAPLALGLMPVFASLRTFDYVRRAGPPLACYALGAVALLPPWRGRGWPLAIGVQLVVLGLILCFGTGIFVAGHELWSPYRWLEHVIPGLSTVRLPIRFHVLAQLGFALLAGLGLERLVRAAPRPLAWPIAGVAAAVVLWMIRGLPSPPLHEEIVPPHVSPAYAWLARNGGGKALLELPAPGFVGSAQRMYMSTYHWQPIVDGYSSYPSRMPGYLQWLARDLPREESLQRVVDRVDVGWLLVHLDELDADRRAQWHPPYPRGLEPVDVPGAEHELLFRVTRPPIDDGRVRLIDTTATPGGLPLAPLAGPCPGEVRLLNSPAQAWKANSTISLGLEATNRGTQPWPAFGFFPRHLVRGRARLSQGGKPRNEPIDVYFGSDVPAGGKAQGYSLFRTVGPGDYQLEFWLAQGADGSLEDCGVARQSVPITVR